MKILVCEDEQALRRIIEVTISARGHVVHGASVVSEAIALFEAAKQSGEPYDLIISDIGLPGPSGYSLAGYVRGAGYTGRLAALTASEPEMGNLASVKAEYWAKTTALQNLVNLVEAVPEVKP
jgi:DNA-binding response OmpR family regulator